MKLPVAAPPRGRFDAGRTYAGIALLCLAAAAATVLGVETMSAGAPRKPAAPSAPASISAAQARTLAAMRYDNLVDGRVAFRADLGSPGTGVRVGGWIDWQRPMVYLASLAATPGPADGLVQAVPGLIAIHSGRPAGTAAPDGYPVPPALPPADGWRLRPLDPTAASGAAFDQLTALLFGLAAEKPDDAGQVAASGARYVRRDAVSSVPVSVFSAPPGPSPAPTSPGQTSPGQSGGPASIPPLYAVPLSGSASPSSGAAPSSGASPSSGGSSSAPASASPSVSPSPSAAGPATYWLDDNSRLRRLDAVLGGGLPLRIDFDRATVPALNAAALLGGATVQPRPVTADEARMLAELPVKDRAAKGGTVTLAVPVGASGLVQGTGWLDWRTPAVYLALRDLDDAASGSLLRADHTGVTTRGATGTGAGGAPPLKPPTDGWAQSTWAQRAGASVSTVDIDALLTTVVNLGGGTREDPSPLRTTANWLRTDTIGGVPVTVFEIRGANETAAPGHARLRYWVDKDGVLRRLEVLTAAGGYGYLDLAPGTPPVLPRPVAKKS